MSGDRAGGQVPFLVRRRQSGDEQTIARLAVEHWGSDVVVNSAGRYMVSALDGFVAVADTGIVALAALAMEDGACHVVALASDRPRRGVGTALLSAAEAEARRQGCASAWLITTNDNLEALGFYQRRGYRLVALNAGAMAAARLIKPAIPAVAANGIPIRDELVLEKPL
ncbi:MAG: GNAT family N-acetyltransferase [Alphaproteobacteria bacterium]